MTSYKSEFEKVKTENEEKALYNKHMARNIFRELAGYLNIVDMARRIGVKVDALRYKIDQNTCPGPTHEIAGKRYYKEEDVPKVQATAQVGYSPRQAAKHLGITRGTLYELTRGGILSPGSIRHGKRQRYTEEDLAKLKEEMRQRVEWRAENPGNKIKAAEREAAGYYTISAAARKVGMPKITFDSWITKGNFPRPKRFYTTFLCYNDEDIALLRDLMKFHGYERRT